MIEKRIFYLWCGSEKPVDVECCVLSWHRQLPDYESALIASGNRHTAVCLSLGVELSSPRVRLVLRLYFLRAYNKKALLLARLFEQQLAERQRFELWEDSHPRRFSRPLH